MGQEVPVCGGARENAEKEQDMCEDEFDEVLAGMVPYTDATARAASPAKRKDPAGRSFSCLRECALWAGICGGIGLLLWQFQVRGLMAMEAAYPCILACSMIGSFGVGLNVRK